MLRNGVRLPASVIATDPANDVAVLYVPGVSDALGLGTSQNVRVGAEVFSMGYPLASIQGGELRANFGRVNALSGIGGDGRYLQIDVPVQPGSSGGPLIGSDGLVVGIVTARLNDMMVLEETGSLPENIGYAIKIDYLLPLLPQQMVRSTARLRGTMEERVEAGRRAVVLVFAE